MISSGDEYIVEEEEEVDEEEGYGSDGDDDVDDDDEDDLTNKIVLKKFNFATDVAKLAMETVVNQCIPNTKIVDLCVLGDKIITEQVENYPKKTKVMKRGIAFPTSVSVNKKVCNVSLVLSDTTVLSENDVVRVEMAAHIDGFIATIAHTVVVTETAISGGIGNLITAADTARKDMVARVQHGIRKQEVFDAVQTQVEAFDCKILELRCHRLKQFQIDDGQDEAFQLNKVYSVELFMSSKSTTLTEMDDVNTGIYKLLAEDEIQFKGDIPKGYVLINQKFQQMSFNYRSLETLGINDLTPLKSAGILKTYPVLFMDDDDVLVVHFKFTMYVNKKGAVNKTFHKVQKISRSKADVLARKKGDNDIKRALQYCGKLPLGANGSGATPVINDISWNFHKLYKKDNVLACTGSFGTYMFRRQPTGDVGSFEDLEQGWIKEELCTIAGKLCEWCPSEGSILALGAVDTESDLGLCYLLDRRSARVPKLVYKSHDGTSVGINSLSWSSRGVHLLATFNGTNAFAVLTRKVRSLETHASYIRFQSLRKDKADFYGVFHPLHDIFFVASTAGILKVYKYEMGQKGSRDGWYYKRSYDMHIRLPDVPDDIGFTGISISKPGDTLTCMRTDGHILILKLDYESISTWGTFKKISVLSRPLNSVSRANLKWTRHVLLAVVDAVELITIYAHDKGGLNLVQLCDNKIDTDVAKSCNQLNMLEWHPDDLLASSSEDGFVHFWMLIWPNKSYKKFASKTRDIFSEKMFYLRKLLQHGVGQMLSGDSANILDALNQFSSASTGRITQLEGKVQKADSAAMQVQKRIQHGEAISQDDLKKFVEELLMVLTTED